MTRGQDESDVPWTQGEKNHAEKLGGEIANDFNVRSARELAAMYFEHGNDAKGLELLNAADSAANFYSTKVYEVTGKQIYYSQGSNRWHDFATGRFTQNPYVNVGWDAYEIEQNWLNKYT